MLPFFCSQLYSSIIFTPTTLADGIKTSNNKILLEHAYYFAARFLLKADFPAGEIATNLEKIILNPDFKETLKSGKTITVAAQLQTAFIDSIAKRRLPKALSDAFITKRLFNDLELKTIYSRFNDEWMPRGQFFVLDSTDDSLEKPVITALKSKSRAACLFNTGEASAPRWVTLGIAFDSDDVHVYIMDPDKAGGAFTDLHQDRFTALLTSHDIITLVETPKRRGSLGSDASDASGSDKDSDDGASTETDSAGSGVGSDSGTSSGRVSTAPGDPDAAGAASGGAGTDKPPKKSLWQKIFGGDKKNKKIRALFDSRLEQRKIEKQQTLFTERAAVQTALSAQAGYTTLAMRALAATDDFIARVMAAATGAGGVVKPDAEEFVKGLLSPVDDFWADGLAAALVAHAAEEKDPWHAASAVAKALMLVSADKLVQSVVTPCTTVQHLECSACNGQSFIEGYEGFDIPLRTDGFDAAGATPIAEFLASKREVTTWCDNCQELSKKKLPITTKQIQKTQVFWGASTPCAVLRIERVAPDRVINKHKITFPADGQCSVYGMKMQVKSVVCLAGERLDDAQMMLITQAGVTKADGSVVPGADAFTDVLTTGQHDGAVGYLYVCEPAPVVVPPLVRTAATRGLVWRDNSCYQNSALQAMFACEPLRTRFHASLTAAAGPRHPVVPSLKAVFDALMLPGASVFDPLAFHTAVWGITEVDARGNKTKPFIRGSQEDATQCVRMVFDILKDQGVIDSVRSKSGSVIYSPVIDRLTLSSKLMCQKCFTPRVAVPENTNILALSLDDKTTPEPISTLVTGFFTNEPLSDGERPDCALCKEKTNHTKELICAWDDNLEFVILQIKRFVDTYVVDPATGSSIKKISTPVTFPDNGVFAIRGKLFRVVSVIMQWGSLNSGHYFAVTPHAELNDSRVTETTDAFRQLMTTGEYNSAQGYLYFCVPL